MSDSKEYYDFLISKGLSTQDAHLGVMIKNQGITMVKASARFNRLYDDGEIDGFPESSIEVLEYFYGRENLKKMKPETLIKKVSNLQQQLTTEIDDEFIKQAVEYYLS